MKTDISKTVFDLSYLFSRRVNRIWENNTVPSCSYSYKFRACVTSHCVLLTEISARKCGKPHPGRHEKTYSLGTCSRLGHGISTWNSRGTPFPSLSLTYSPPPPIVEDDEEKSNYWGTWFWGGFGDERKTCLSVFLSVTVACNPEFIHRFLNCDPDTTSVLSVLFVIRRDTMSAICPSN
jgi:hypothetical protein